MIQEEFRSDPSMRPSHVRHPDSPDTSVYIILNQLSHPAVAGCGADCSKPACCPRGLSLRCYVSYSNRLTHASADKNPHNSHSLSAACTRGIDNRDGVGLMGGRCLDYHSEPHYASAPPHFWWKYCASYSATSCRFSRHGRLLFTEYDMKCCAESHQQSFQRLNQMFTKVLMKQMWWKFC